MLQYSCLENSGQRSLASTVRGATKSQTCLSELEHQASPWIIAHLRILCPQISPGDNTEVGSHSFLKGFLTQISNLGLQHCKKILYHLSHQGSPLQVQSQTKNCVTPKGDHWGSLLPETNPYHIPEILDKNPSLNFSFILLCCGNPLQYSYLENPMDRGAWWATIHGITKSRTRLSDFSVCVLLLLEWLE